MKAFLSIFAAVLAGAVFADPYVKQIIPYESGNNWVYIEPTPTNDACEAIFAAASNVTAVMLYDGRAYARTAQYDSEGKLINQKPVPFKVWHRNSEKTSTFNRIIGGRIYKIVATGIGEIKLTGCPQLPQLYWNECTVDKDDEFNFVAPTFANETSGVLTKDYFGEGPAGENPEVVKRMTPSKEDPVSPRTALISCNVYMMSARRTADWGGVIGVAGADNGLTFTSNGENRISFALQNLGTTNHTFCVTYGPGEDTNNNPPPLLLWNGNTWTNFVSKNSYDFDIAPNAQAIVSLAVSPTSRQEGSGLLTVTDLGATKMRVRLPVVVEPAAQASGLWPDGLYIGSFTLGSVSYTNATPVQAGGSVKGSLIYHQKGATGTLLQRICVGTQTNGVTVYGLNLDSVRNKVASGTTVRRLSSVVFDPYNPRVSATVKDGKGTFTWKIDKHAPTNPMRHSWHPDHDGLTRLSNGTTQAAPDGDDFKNYSESVKPELFSINNSVALTGLPVSTNQTGAIDGTVSGTITWTLQNLRAPSSGGDITCAGTFSLMRVGTVDVIE